MSAPPCHQLRYIVVGDVGDQRILAKEVEQIADLPFGVPRTGMMLTDLEPIAAGNSVERERGCGGTRQRHLAFSLFACVALYRFGFAFVGLFSRAVKRTTVDLE